MPFQCPLQNHTPGRITSIGAGQHHFRVASTNLILSLGWLTKRLLGSVKLDLGSLGLLARSEINCPTAPIQERVLRRDS